MFKLKFLSKLKKSLALSLLMLMSISTSFAQALPGNISDFTAEPGDQSMKLKWTAATDTDGGTITEYTLYYGNDSVGDENNNTYQDSVTIGGDQTEYEVFDLINGVRYYFAMTATDDEGNESPYYSDEASGIPGEVSDSTLVVLSAEQVDLDRIEVTMSKSIKVDSQYDAFKIEDDTTGIGVPIINTEVNSEVATLYVGGGTLGVGTVYKITATLGVSDLEGTPISSGITDTVKFTAKDSFTKPQTEQPVEENIDDLFGDNSGGGTEVDINNEDDFWDSFLDEDGSETGEKTEVENNVEETIDPFDSTNLEDNIPLEESNTSQNEIENNQEKTIPAIKDTEKPEEATNVKIDKTFAQTKGKVRITWSPSTSDDVMKQIIYVREGMKTWDKGTELSKTTSDYTLDVKKNQNYQLRLTTLDVAGNKSYGKEFTFSTSLVSTGRNTNMIMILGFCFLVLMFIKRRSVA